MKKEDFKRFCTVIYWLAGKYCVSNEPRKFESKWLMEYFDVISDLPIEYVEIGVKHHYGHNEFFPERPASLRKSIADMPVKPKLKAAYNTAQIPEFTAQEHVDASGKLDEILASLEGKFGPSNRPHLSVAGKKAA